MPSMIDPVTGEVIEVPDRPFRIALPFLRQEIGSGDVVKTITQAVGVNRPCGPCEERRKAFNRALTFGPWT